jgi:predicted nucleic acid-binding protein
MTWIVDASVAVKWFVRESLHDEAMRLLDHIEPLQAPDLIVAEVTNIAWKKRIRGEIAHTQAEAIATAIRQYIPALHSSAELNERALEIALALNHPVYDCLYIACAEKTDAILITANEKLCALAEKNGFGELVRHLGDPSTTL